jgi:hypothetical protein
VRSNDAFVIVPAALSGSAPFEPVVEEVVEGLVRRPKWGTETSLDFLHLQLVAPDGKERVVVVVVDLATAFAGVVALADAPFLSLSDRFVAGHAHPVLCRTRRTESLLQDQSVPLFAGNSGSKPHLGPAWAPKRNAALSNKA